MVSELNTDENHNTASQVWNFKTHQTAPGGSVRIIRQWLKHRTAKVLKQTPGGRAFSADSIKNHSVKYLFRTSILIKSKNHLWLFKIGFSIKSFYEDILGRLVASFFSPVLKVKPLLRFRVNDWLYLCCWAQIQIRYVLEKHTTRNKLCPFHV